MIEYSKKDVCVYYNLLGFRQWMNTKNLPTLYDEINRIIISNGAKKAGPLISCTHSLKKNGIEDEINFEILVPISKKIVHPLGFWFCEEFKLENVIDVHVVEKEENIADTTRNINKYIHKNGIIPKTPTYSILHSDADGITDVHFVFGV